MERFLDETKSSLHHLSKNNKVHIVLGNESCDLDSAVAALVYAFYLYKGNVHPGKMILPVMNIHSNEIRLRTEIINFFKETSLPLDLLIFRENIDLKALHESDKLSITLVDHNQLSRNDRLYQSSVIEVIDHHQKEANYDPSRCQVTIEMVGSCCTLIAEVLLNRQREFIDQQIALLLYGTILLDTVCLSDAAKRVTSKDKNIATELEKIIGVFDRKGLFQKLYDAKFNISDLTLDDLLHKDFKVISNNTMNITVASLTALLEGLLARPGAESDLHKFSSETNSQIVVLMGIQIDFITEETTRQLAIYSSVQGYREQLMDVLEGVSLYGPKLQLRALHSSFPSVALYQQGNFAASRKVILPLLNTFLLGDKSPSLSNGSAGSCSGTTMSTNCEVKSSNKRAITENRSEDDDLANFDPLTSESEDVFDSLANSTTHLHVLGMGDPISHAGSSQSSSNQNSCPYTPQNSCTDGGLELDPYARQILPSFNSREMMEKIESKRGKLRGYVGEGEIENLSYPFTPKNSFVDNTLDSYVKNIPAFDSSDFLLKVNEKVSTMSASHGDEGNGNITVEVPVIDHPIDIKTLKNGHLNISTVKEKFMLMESENGSQENQISLNAVVIRSESENQPQDGNDEGQETVQCCPEAVSLSEKLDKSDEKMDTSETSGSSEKTLPLDNLEVHTCTQSNNLTTDTITHTSANATASSLTLSTTTTNSVTTTTNANLFQKSMEIHSETATSNARTESTASTSSFQEDADLELPSNYQTETVDFPDSPRQLKLMNQSSNHVQGTSIDESLQEEEEETEQPDDEVFRAVLSPSSDGVKLKKERPNTLNASGKKKRKIRVNPDILNSTDEMDDNKSLSSLSNRSEGDILSPIDDMATPDDIDTPEELEDSTCSPSEPIPEVSAAEERDEERRWRTCVIGGVQRKIDMKVIEPYKKVLSHGGYYGPKRSAIIVFCACYLPDHSRKDYDYVMDNLFLYVLTTLDQLVAEDYMLIYLHGAMDRNNMPTFGWLKRCYQMIDRRLRKNLKGLYLVHPTFWLKTIVLMTKPFISSKFARKLRFVNTLQELTELVPIDPMSIPDRVKQLEFELMIKEKKRHFKPQKYITPKPEKNVKKTSNNCDGDDEEAYRRSQVGHVTFTGGWV